MALLSFVSIYFYCNRFGKSAIVCPRDILLASLIGGTRMSRTPLLERREARTLLDEARVSPEQVRECGLELSVFLQRYLPIFYRDEQREHARLVLHGRLSDLERKTSEPIARLAGQHRKPVQNFVGAGAWDDEAVLS